MLKGELFTTELDDKLQNIVSEASKETGFPVAIISIVLHRTTFYRAFVGLETDLINLRSTDTSATFCQYVVKNKKPLRIIDAKKEPSLPQQLVDLYGIRSYYGVPLEVEGEVVGSLCVVDSKPNDVKDESKVFMENLGKQASLRLNELTKQSAKAWPLLEEIKQAKIKDIWTEVAQARQELRLAIAELHPIVQMVAGAKKGEIKDVAPLMEVIQDATSAYDDLKKAMAQFDQVLNRLKKEAK